MSGKCGWAPGAGAGAASGPVPAIRRSATTRRNVRRRSDSEPRRDIGCPAILLEARWRGQVRIATPGLHVEHEQIHERRLGAGGEVVEGLAFRALLFLPSDPAPDPERPALRGRPLQLAAGTEFDVALGI